MRNASRGLSARRDPAPMTYRMAAPRVPGPPSARSAIRPNRLLMGLRTQVFLSNSAAAGCATPAGKPWPWPSHFPRMAALVAAERMRLRDLVGEKCCN